MATRTSSIIFGEATKAAHRVAGWKRVERRRGRLRLIGSLYPEAPELEVPYADHDFIALDPDGSYVRLRVVRPHSGKTG